MFRRVSLALAIAAALAPLNVQSLGLGEIQSKSYLNQTLDADIELLSVAADELDGIKVTLASVEEFKRAGIDRPFVLNSLRFEAVRLPNGKLVIRASSKDPIREPFLNFLVEVNWPKGRLLREYTVLLDPPVTLPRRPRPVAAPVASAPRAAATAPRAVANAPRAETPRQAPTTMPAGSGEYGPIQPNATLWSIAKRLQMEGATVEQVMMALLDENPGAFIDGNINLLKAGQTLRIPAQEAARERSVQQAREQFLQQLADWQPAPEAEAPAVAGVTDGPAAEPAPPPDPTPGALPVVEESVPEARLALTTRSEEEAEALGVGLGGGVDNQVLEQELLLAREESAVVRREGEQLRARVDELESQLEDLQRLLSVQSDELARLQQAAAVESEGLEGMGVDTEPAGGTEVSGAADVEDPQPVSPTLAGDEPQPEQPEALQTAAAQPAPEPGLVGRLLSGDPLMIGGLGAAGALVLTLVGLAFRRRREDSLEDEFAEEEAMAAPVSRAAAVDSVRPKAMKAQETTVDQNPFGGFQGSASAAPGAAAEQLDALSEVDVYIAYGRYEQAEELLKHELESQPERLDLKHRLLEIYGSTSNKVAFVNLAEEMSRSGAAAEDPESWREVLRKGGELAPKNPLFAAAGAATAGAVPGQAQPESASAGLEFDLDLDALEAEDLRAEQPIGSQADLQADQGLAAGADPQPEAETDSGFDFDLDLDTLAGAETPQSESAEADQSMDADLDLDKLFAFDSDQEAAEGAGEPMVQTPGTQAGERQPKVASAEDETLDLALSEVEFQTDDGESLSLDEVAGSFMPEPDLMAVQPPQEAEELSLEDIADDAEKNEVETMLDLAQIYADMGDPDDARDILEEAMKDGDEGQQQRAKEILQSLA